MALLLVQEVQARSHLEALQRVCTQQAGALTEGEELAHVRSRVRHPR